LYGIIKCIIAAILLLTSFINYSQDSTKKKIDTTFKPIRFIISENTYNYINPSAPDTITRKRLLWYPLKNIDDIFNFLPGYYLKVLDVGQIGQLTFNQLGAGTNGILRNGRPINDLIDGSVDLNLLSRNEIAEIEVSNGYGNSLYNYENSVNIIQRQQFQYRPYTELAFWQDRYDNDFIDVNFSQNFFKGFNFNMGVTKHSYTGKYTHSYFDVWLGRFNFNIAPSNNLNFFLYSNYAKIDRGLTEGIDENKVDITNKDDIFDPALAVVKNPDAYENKERFDVDAGAMYQKGISFTKLQAFVSNSFRWYRDPDNYGTYIKNNLHWINYGIKLKQELNFKPGKNINILSNTELETGLVIQQLNQLQLPVFSWTSYAEYNTINLLQNIDVKYKKLTLSGYVTGEKVHYINQIDIYSGLKGMYKFQFDSSHSVSVYSIFNQHHYYSGSGVKASFGSSNISAEYYFYKYYSNLRISGINAAGNIRIKPIEFNFNFTSCFDYDKLLAVPEFNGNLELSYHDTGIKNKLEYKVGFNTRFWSKYTSYSYRGLTNSFYYNPADSVNIPSNATLDFFIIGKIDKATFGLTFENILDRVIYNMGVYPAMDRGGLFNVWSRFNITWYFFD
jgi:hypothetical protein